MPLRLAPEGLALPSQSKDEYEEGFMPLQLKVNFKPKENILYKSKFRFMVKNGLSCDLIVKGQGSYEETDD